MGTRIINMNPQQEITQLRLVKSELKAFTINYMKTVNLITVTGWSNTDDAWIKYCQTLADIESHLKSKNELKVYFNLEVFDASSAGYLFKIIKRLNRAKAEGKNVQIFWSYSSSVIGGEMLDAGLDLMGLCDFEFQITER